MTGVGIFILGSVLQAAATNEGCVFAGRIIGGWAIGMFSHVVPMYQSEIAPAEIRGSLVALQQFSITIGILVSFWLDYGFHYIGGVTCRKGAKHDQLFDAYAMNGHCDGQKEIAWRIPLALQVIPALILGIGMAFFPYSPRWLASKGRESEALAVVSKLRGLPTEAPAVKTEFMDILAEVRFDREVDEECGKQGWRLVVHQYVAMFKAKPMLKRLAIGCTLQLFQQFTGINAIIYYAPTIFQGLGLDGTTTSLLATGVGGFVNVIFTVPAIFWLDVFGRRTFLMMGATGMGISHATVAALSAVFDKKFAENPWAGWLGVSFVYFFIANFAYSWGPIGWVLPSEIFPISSRSKAMSITTATSWLMNFVVGRATPSMLDKIGWITYAIFAGCCALMGLWVFFFVPETKGKPLEVMDEVFGDNTAQEDADRMTRIKSTMSLDPSIIRHNLAAVEKTASGEKA